MLRISRVALAGILAGIFLALAPGVLPGSAVRADNGDAGVSQERPVRPDPGNGSLRPVPALDCDTVCTQKADRVLKACVDRGGSRERCRNAARKSQAECLTRCNVAPVSGCRDKCEREANQAERACRAHGGDETDCKAKANLQLRHCLAACATTRPVPVEPGDCQARCAAHARASYQACVAKGEHSPEECGNAANIQLKHCMSQCATTRPVPVEPAPGECAARCERHAQEILQTCLDNNEHDCKDKAAQALRECTARCKPGSGGGELPPPSCADKCAHDAAEVERTCRAAPGATPEDCRAQGEAALKECLSHCTAAGTPPNQCVLDCETAARAYYDKCMVDHDNPDACAARARHELALCKEGCVKPGQQ